MYTISNRDELEKLKTKLINSWVCGDECENEIILGGFARSLGDDYILTFDTAAYEAHLYVNSVNLVHFGCMEHVFSHEDAVRWATDVWNRLNG